GGSQLWVAHVGRINRSSTISRQHDGNAQHCVHGGTSSNQQSGSRQLVSTGGGSQLRFKPVDRVDRSSTTSRQRDGNAQYPVHDATSLNRQSGPGSREPAILDSTHFYQSLIACIEILNI
nr:hypothetical protein [Tanacetum cinerariifolium]